MEDGDGGGEPLGEVEAEGDELAVQLTNGEALATAGGPGGAPRGISPAAKAIPTVATMKKPTAVIATTQGEFHR